MIIDTTLSCFERKPDYIPEQMIFAFTTNEGLVMENGSFTNIGEDRFVTNEDIVIITTSNTYNNGWWCP